MKEFATLSGPWTGMSVQGMSRLTESIQLRIGGGGVSGYGNDVDGQFDLAGSYDSSTRRVTLTRVYSWTIEPTQESVGVPFQYTGEWDGAMVSGFWWELGDPRNHGPFEMWPSRDEDMRELEIMLDRAELVNQS